MKKFAVFVLVLSFLISLLGCGANNANNGNESTTSQPTSSNESTTSQSTSSSASQSDTVSKEPITITMATWIDSTTVTDPDDPEKKSMEENRWVNAFKDHLGITLKYKWISPDVLSYVTKWNTAMASQDLPDAARVYDEQYSNLLDAGMIMDMTDLYDKYASTGYKNGIDDEMYQQMVYNGKLYGLPFPQNAYHAGNVLWIRQDWLDKVNMKPPKTMDDVVAIARAFVKAKLGGDSTIGLMFGNDTGMDGKWNGFFNAYGSYREFWGKDYWIKDGDKLVNGVVQDKTKDALLAFQSLYKEGLINKDFAAASHDVTREYVVSGKTGLFYGDPWAPVDSMESLCKTDPQAKIISVYPPSLTGEPLVTETNSPEVMRIFVNAEFKEPERIIDMINLTEKLEHDDYSNYCTDSSSFLWWKFLPWVGGTGFVPVTHDIDLSNAIRVAANGDTSILDKNPEYAEIYKQWKEAKEKKNIFWLPLLHGPQGSYSLLYDAYHEGLLLTNGFYGLPTKTMALKRDILNDKLIAAMEKVMTGSDISVFEKAVSEWYSSGGQQITDEVNEWYQSRK